MANDDSQGLKYLVTIGHRERGTGFVAKDALQNAQKQESSPIIKARFSRSGSNSRSFFEVTMDDAPLQEVISQALQSHGRLLEGSYTIEGIELVEEENPLKSEVKSLRKQNGSLQRRIGSLREESSGLKKELEESRAEITTPLEGLLAYFKTQNYAPSTVFEDSGELDFALSLLNGDVENTLVNYVNHMSSYNFTEERIEEVLNYQPMEEAKFSELKTKYEKAKEHSDYFEKMQKDKAPKEVLNAVRKVMETNNYNTTIQEYESYIKTDEDTKPLQKRLKSLKGKYQSFSENIALLNEAGEEIPTIFQEKENCLEIYFPFNTGRTSKEFIETLAEEIKTYFSSKAKVTNIDESHFVAYRIENEIGLYNDPSDIINDVPVTLKTAGFNKILPYRLR